jgi:uncharacterized membrane protein YdcZ (DUF606 family)
MPAWIDAVLAIGLSVLFAVAGVLLGRALARGHVLEGHNDVIAPIFVTAGVIYAVLLGFLVVAVWESYDAASANAAHEATTLTTLYRLTAGMRHPEERVEMRAGIRAYTQAVIDDEWASLALTGKPSPLTRAAMGRIYTAFSHMPLSESGSQVNGSFLRALSTIINDRNRRVVQAGESLPWILWVGLTLGGAIVVGMTFIMYMEQTWPHVLASSVLAALIGTLLFVTILLDHPFAGPLALDPGPFEYAVGVYDSVDRGS